MANGLVGLKMKLLLLCGLKGHTIVCVYAANICPFSDIIALCLVKLKLKVVRILNFKNC